MKRIEHIKQLMSSTSIEDLEIIWATKWPLRWIAPVNNQDYDYDDNLLELDKSYEHSGTSQFYMISFQTEIVITKNEDDSYTLEDGLVWAESHSWCKEIKESTPGTLPWYIKKECKDFQTLVGTLEEMYNVQYEILEDGGECIDIDGNSYKTVKIGNQLWMAENLRVTKYRNGDKVTHFIKESGSSSQEGYCNYWNKDGKRCKEPAYKDNNLYNWACVIDKRGLAPNGWHIPSEQEFQTLIDYFGGEEDMDLFGKVVNGDFKALLAGKYDPADEQPSEENEAGYFWSVTGYTDPYSQNQGSTAVESKNVWNLFLFIDEEVYLDSQDKSVFMSIRCVENSD